MKTSSRRALSLSLALAFSASSCAVLHHAQIGEIDARNPGPSHRVDIKVSEMGFDLEEAGAVARAASRTAKGAKAIDDIVAIISLFQQGPVTGNAVFSDSYAKNLVHSLYKECPSGRLTGLVMMRETRKYPVISGEVVRITGTCFEAADKKHES